MAEIPIFQLLAAGVADDNKHVVFHFKDDSDRIGKFALTVQDAADLVPLLLLKLSDATEQTLALNAVRIHVEPEVSVQTVLQNGGRLLIRLSNTPDREPSGSPTPESPQRT